jgi:hypothetical protein
VATAASPAPLARFDHMLDGTLDLGEVIEMHNVLDELDGMYERAMNARKTPR